MPGIVGIIAKAPYKGAEAELLCMVESLRHEPFYETGTFADPSLGIYVGWVARKGSFSTGMPLYNEQRDTLLVFSGEDFPEPGTSRRLKERGHTLELDGPSYLVHLCEEDPTFPAALNGRFHGVVIDRRRGTTTLFNDRFGMQRLYYHDSSEAFYFAAEAKALLTVRPELRAVDPRGLGEFITCGCVLEMRTLFKGIHILPSAAAWVFRRGSIESKDKYFAPQEWENQAPLDMEPYYQELRTVFSGNLHRYFSGQQQVGMSLTGGLDTRMILAWSRADQGTLPCYSFGGTLRDSQDVLLARQIASLCRQPYTAIHVGDDFLSRFPHYAERTVYLTDGCTGVDCSPDLYINQLAREIAPVRMTGNYGGEILRGVRAFRPQEPTTGLFARDLLPQVEMAKATFADLVKSRPLTFAAFQQAPWHHYGLLALEETQLTLRTPYLDNDFVRTVYRAPESALMSHDVSLRLIADGNAALQGIRTDRGLAGNQGRFSGALTRSFLTFTFKAEYAYDHGMPQWVAKIDSLFMPLHLERLFLGRHKFNHFRLWYRDLLSRYVREMLLDSRTLSRPYIERARVDALVNGHLSGGRNYTNAIHKLLTLELIHRLFIDAT